MSDMIRRGNLRTRSIKLLVLDEADEMLAKGTCNYIVSKNFMNTFNLGFKEQIYDIYRHLAPATQVLLPRTRHDSNLYDYQVVLVSATLPHEVLEITTKFMTDPIRVLVKR